MRSTGALGDCVTIHPQYFTDRRQLDRGCSRFYHVFCVFVLL